jgi:hypothetical protein
MKRDHHTGRAWWAPLAELDYWRWRKRQKAADATPEAAPAVPRGVLRIARVIALGLATVIVVAASAAAFAESYRALWLWALRHGLAGFWADVFALQVDSFIAVGELALFVALIDQWKARARAFPWLVTLGGLAVSVAANVGHVAGADLATRATAAVPPVAAASALAVGLGILKRVVTARRAPAATVPASGPDVVSAPPPGDAESAAEASLRATLAAGNPWSLNQLSAQFSLTRAQATRVRSRVLAGANGHRPEGDADNAVS